MMRQPDRLSVERSVNSASVVRFNYCDGPGPHYSTWPTSAFVFKVLPDSPTALTEWPHLFGA